MSSFKIDRLRYRIIQTARVYFSWVRNMRRTQMEKYRKLGLNIAYYRKSKRLSQEQLAELANISRTHMSRIETAECAVSLDVVFALCDALDVTPRELFDFRR